MPTKESFPVPGNASFFLPPGEQPQHQIFFVCGSSFDSSANNQEEVKQMAA
jgi:hypothetical protein